MHFAEDTTVCLNPFELVEDYAEEEDALVGLMQAMASPEGHLSDWQKAAFKRLMGELWQQQGKALQVDDIAAACLADADQRLKDVGTQLHAFTRSGGYGRYFSGRNTVSFKNPLTVLELDELQGRKHLRQIVLLQLIYQIQQAVFLGERGRLKLVIIDEAWDLLKTGEVSVFIEHAYRKFRKYGGSVVIATQSLNDLYGNAVGQAIAENSANLLLLGQTREAVESLKAAKRLDLPEGGYSALKTVHTHSGVYSEIFVKSETGSGIGRLIVSDFQKLLYSTDPNDWQAIEAEKKRGLSLPAAIRAVLAQRQ